MFEFLILKLILDMTTIELVVDFTTFPSNYTVCSMLPIIEFDHELELKTLVES